MAHHVEGGVVISNDVEFKQTIAQMDRMYRILAELKSRLSSAHPSQYHVMTEGSIDEIRRMQAEIDAYLGVNITAGDAARVSE